MSKSQSNIKAETLHSATFPQRLNFAIGGKSVYRFAMECQISQSNLSKYMRGQNLPGYDALIRIADASNVSLEWLMRGDETSLPAQKPLQPHTKNWSLTPEHIESSVNGFSLRLDAAISTLGCSVSEFAKKAGIVESVLREYLRGDVLPGLESFMKIATTAKVSLEWLATGQGEIKTVSEFYVNLVKKLIEDLRAQV